MKTTRIWKDTLLPIVVVLLLAAVLPACETDHESFFIDYMLMPEDDCSYSSPSAGSKTHAIYHTVDVFLANLNDVGFRYLGVFAVVNDMITREMSNNAILESNGVYVTGAYVGIEGVDRKDRFDYIAGALIEPGNVGAGFAHLLVWEDVAPYLADCNYNTYGWPTGEILTQITVSVYFTGKTQGGLEVETPEFLIPIDICCGCLISWDDIYASGVTYPLQPPEQGATPPCCDVTYGGPMVPCTLGQDEPLSIGFLASCEGYQDWCSSGTEKK